MPGFLALGDPIPSTPPMHGLQASVSEVTGPPRWELGATFCPENCVEAAGWDPNCLTWPEEGKPDKSDADDLLDCYDVLPFVLESPFKCDASGFQVIDFSGRARRQLEASTSKGMEFELWTATIIPDNPSLDAGAVVLASGAAVGLRRGLALLGAALSDCAHGGRGTIHAPSWIVDNWLGLYGMMFKFEGARIVTANRGDVVIAGTGYPGTGVDGLSVDPGKSWVYATGPINYRIGPIDVFPDTVAEAHDHKRNNIEYRAERMSMVNFDTCCHFGVLIDSAVE